MKYVVAIILLTCYGCGDHFRYPCQNPKNWENADCQRPQCAILQQCPDQLIKPEEMKGDAR
jgi:hypothetical protein